MKPTNETATGITTCPEDELKIHTDGEIIKDENKTKIYQLKKKRKQTV